MKIKYIAEDDLIKIKSNITDLYIRVINNNETIESIFNDEKIVKDSSYEIREFSLDISQPKEKSYLTDIENIQRVYNNMKCLSDSQASDERIWAAYTFSYFKDYMKYRWERKKVDASYERYILKNPSHRALLRQGISRLWWYGRLTYDESRLDPYELTKFLCKDQDRLESLFGRNMFSNPNIGMGTIIALYDADKSGINVDRHLIRNITKYLNILAGTYALDSMNKDEIYSRVRKEMGF